MHGRRAVDVADEALEEINARFKEHAIGYQYTDPYIIRMDSEITHEEIVKPALTVLRGEMYAAAQAEFLKGHKHYRKGEFSDALTECCKAFESTMKVICSKRKWTVDKNAPASTLVKACLDNGFISFFGKATLVALRACSNPPFQPREQAKRTRSGNGGRPQCPGEPARYVLNMTASTILFLAEADRKL